MEHEARHPNTDVPVRVPIPHALLWLVRLSIKNKHMLYAQPRFAYILECAGLVADNKGPGEPLNLWTLLRETAVWCYTQMGARCLACIYQSLIGKECLRFCFLNAMGELRMRESRQWKRLKRCEWILGRDQETKSKKFKKETKTCKNCIKVQFHSKNNLLSIETGFFLVILLTQSC